MLSGVFSRQIKIAFLTVALWIFLHTIWTYFGRDISQPRTVPVREFVLIFLRWPNGHHGAVVAGSFFSGTMLNRLVIRDSKPCWFFPSYHIYRNLILQRKERNSVAQQWLLQKKNFHSRDSITHFSRPPNRTIHSHNTLFLRPP